MKRKHNNRGDNKMIILIVVFVVFVVIDTINGYIVGTSDLPFWVKYWLLS